MSGLRERLAEIIRTGVAVGFQDEIVNAAEVADAAILALRQWLADEGLVCVPRALATKYAYVGASYLAREGIAGLSPDVFAAAWDEVVFSIAAAPDPLGDGP